MEHSYYSDGLRRPPSITRKRDGLLMVRSDGSCRFLSWWESIVYRVSSRLPSDSTGP